MSTLTPAAELAAAASKPYPNDSAKYHEARTRLLAEEIELRRHIERVSEMRRALPLGGQPRDYRFKEFFQTDLTPAGRGADWYPKLEYPGAGGSQ